MTVGTTPLRRTKYFSFQGAVLVGETNLADEVDEDGLVKTAGNMEFLGNIEKLDYGFKSDVEIIKETYTGLRQTDFQKSYSDEMTLDFTLCDSGPLAWSIAHRGTWSVIKAGTASDASIIVWNAARKVYQVVTGTPALFTDYFIGERGTDGRWTPIRNIKASTLLVKDSTGTPKTLVSGTNYTLTPRTGRISFFDLTTGGPFTAPIKGNTEFGTVSDTLDDRIVWGVIQPLAHQRIGAFQIHDSAGTPAVVDPAYYLIDPIYGELTWIASQRAAFEAENYVMPLIATYDHGAVRNMSLMSAPLDREYAVRMRGKNTADNNAPVLWDLYRVQFTPVENAQLIHERTGRLPVKATALADPSKPEDSILGRVGRVAFL